MPYPNFSLARTPSLNLRLPYGNQLKFFNNALMDSKPSSETRSSSTVSPLLNPNRVNSMKAAVTLEEWQGWGTISPVPSMVTEVIDDLKLLENDIDVQMDFGGNHGKLRGEFKVVEDKKHRAKFLSIKDSEKKLQFFSARQIACRLLGSRDYLCQKCWLPSEDCVCPGIVSCSLCNNIRLWLYMHPKDFLRQNNTGKLLWQVFGSQSATLCLFGIAEHEEAMWNVFSSSGRNNVWCLYPNKNAVPKSVQDAFTEDIPMGKKSEKMNFILIDGTWSNSTAMFQRLKRGVATLGNDRVAHFVDEEDAYDRAQATWGEDLPCISLNAGASLMHKLRPQPSWDRTCTAAAAIGLLCELHDLPDFSHYGLDRQADAIGDALETLCEALTNRRLRMGRSVNRKEKYYSNIC